MKSNNFNIYVGNLSFEMTEDELRSEFTVFGEVASLTIIDDKHTGSGQQRRYSYIEMTSKSEGQNAISNLNGKRLGSTIVNVIRALPISNKNGMGSQNIRTNKQLFRGRKKR